MNFATPAWVRDAVFYQIFPDRFAKSTRFGRDSFPQKPNNLQKWGADPTFHGFQGGDLLGIVDKLDYLQDLGINALYLNPIFASAANHRYHTHDYYEVDPILGGNQAFAELLHAARRRHIRVILDGVFNHVGRGFFQFSHLMECGRESPYVDWFHVHGWPVNAFYENQQPNYDAWWGMHALPKLNTNTPAVREFLWNVAAYWLERGVDGWRLDVPNEIDDDEFWREFRNRCKKVNPEAYLVGELWGDARRWLQGDQFDGQMNYPFARSALGFFAGNRVNHHEVQRSGYDHIEPRTALEFAADLDRMFNQLYRPEVVHTQMNMLGSHDTPRLSTVVNHDRVAVGLMFLCQMTVPGAPNIYYGDEIGMLGAHDPDCRRAFPWHDEATWDRELRDQIRAYIRLRHDLPVLRWGDFTVLHAQGSLVVYQRQYQDRTAVIALNAGYESDACVVPPQFPKRLRERLVKAGDPFAAGEKVALMGRSGRVWSD